MGILNVNSLSSFIFLKMPGDNCSMFGCTVDLNIKEQLLFKVPAPKSEFEKRWKDKLVVVITKDREVDVARRERIESGRLFICEKRWKDKLVVVITKDREVDVARRERIESGRLFICEKRWKDKLVVVITKDREVDVARRERIESGRIIYL